MWKERENERKKTEKRPEKKSKKKRHWPCNRRIWVAENSRRSPLRWRYFSTVKKERGEENNKKKEPRRSRGEVEESHGEPRRATERPQTKKNWEKPRRVIKETRGTKMRWTLTRKNLLPCPSRSPLFHFSLSLSLSLSLCVFLVFCFPFHEKVSFPPSNYQNDLFQAL